MTFFLWSDGFLSNNLTITLGDTEAFNRNDIPAQGFTEVIAKNVVAGKDGGDLVFDFDKTRGFFWIDDITVTPSPEPSAAILLAVGLIGLFAISTGVPNFAKRRSAIAGFLIGGTLVAGLIASPISARVQDGQSAIAAAPAPVCDSSGVVDIVTFQQCLNCKFGGQPVDISSSVRCVPDNCKFTVTMSKVSAQGACFLGGTQLPRIILSCPMPDTDPVLFFRPSFSVCPVGSVEAGGANGGERVEIGQDLKPVTFGASVTAGGGTGFLAMADVPFKRANAYRAKAPASVFNRPNNALSCVNCHGAPAAPDNTAVIPIPAPGRNITVATSKPFNPFNPKRFIFSNDPVAPAVDRAALAGQGINQLTIGEVCDCLSRNLGPIRADPKYGQAPVKADIADELALCQAVKAKVAPNDNSACPIGP